MEPNVIMRSFLNWLFPSSKNPNFQNEVKRKTFLVEKKKTLSYGLALLWSRGLGQVGNGLENLNPVNT